MDHFVDAIAFDARSHSLGGGGGNGNFATTSKEWKFMEEDGEEGDIMDDLASGRTRTPSTKTVRSFLFLFFLANRFNPLHRLLFVASFVCVQFVKPSSHFSSFPFFTFLFLFLLLLSLFTSRPRVHTLATAVHTPLAMPSTLVVTVAVVVATTMMILMIFQWEFFHLRIVVLVNKLHRLPVAAAAEEHLLVVAVIGNKTTPLQWMMSCLRVQIFQHFVVVGMEEGHPIVIVKHHDETQMHQILICPR